MTALAARASIDTRFSTIGGHRERKSPEVLKGAGVDALFLDVEEYDRTFVFELREQLEDVLPLLVQDCQVFIVGGFVWVMHIL